MSNAGYQPLHKPQQQYGSTNLRDRTGSTGSADGSLFKVRSSTSRGQLFLQEGKGQLISWAEMLGKFADGAGWQAGTSYAVNGASTTIKLLEGGARIAVWAGLGGGTGVFLGNFAVGAISPRWNSEARDYYNRNGLRAHLIKTTAESALWAIPGFTANFFWQAFANTFVPQVATDAGYGVLSAYLGWNGAKLGASTGAVFFGTLIPTRWSLSKIIDGVDEHIPFADGTPKAKIAAMAAATAVSAVEETRAAVVAFEKSNTNSEYSYRGWYKDGYQTVLNQSRVALINAGFDTSVAASVSVAEVQAALAAGKTTDEKSAHASASSSGAVVSLPRVSISVNDGDQQKKLDAALAAVQARDKFFQPILQAAGKAQAAADAAFKARNEATVNKVAAAAIAARAVPDFLSNVEESGFNTAMSRYRELDKFAKTRRANYIPVEQAMAAVAEQEQHIKKLGVMQQSHPSAEDLAKLVQALGELEKRTQAAQQKMQAVNRWIQATESGLHLTEPFDDAYFHACTAVIEMARFSLNSSKSTRRRCGTVSDEEKERDILRSKIKAFDDAVSQEQLADAAAEKADTAAGHAARIADLIINNKTTPFFGRKVVPVASSATSSSSALDEGKHDSASADTVPPATATTSDAKSEIKANALTDGTSKYSGQYTGPQFFRDRKPLVEPLSRERLLKDFEICMINVTAAAWAFGLTDYPGGLFQTTNNWNLGDVGTDMLKSGGTTLIGYTSSRLTGGFLKAVNAATCRCGVDNPDKANDIIEDTNKTVTARANAMATVFRSTLS